MLETIAAIGSAASGLGKLVGAFGGKKTPDPAYQIALQEESALRTQKAGFEQKMALAKQHGIHPLSMMGIPMSTFAPSVSFDPGQGVDYEAMGAGLSDMSKAFVKPPEAKAPEASPVDPRQERILDAEVRYREAVAREKEWSALRTQWVTEDLLRGQPGAPPGVRSSNDGVVTRNLAAAQAGVSPSVFSGGGVSLKQEVAPPHPSILGHAMGADQSFQRMVDSGGNLYSMVNPNAFSLDFEKPGTFNYLANKYGAEKAMDIMGVIENLGPAGGIVAGAGTAGYGLYEWRKNKREKKEHMDYNYRSEQSWRGRGSRQGLRGAPSRPNYRQPF